MFAAAPATACTKYGVWKGRWHQKGYAGPVEIRVGKHLGISYASLRSSNPGGRLLPAETYHETGRENRVRFNSNAGQYDLEKKKCRLVGAQQHRTGRVKIVLERVGSAPHHRTPSFMSGNSLNSVVGETFTDQWRWGKHSGVHTVTFQKSDRGVVVKIKDRGRSDGWVRVQTKNGWMRYTYTLSGRTMTDVMRVTQHGKLYGFRQRGAMLMFAEMNRH